MIYAKKKFAFFSLKNNFSYGKKNFSKPIVRHIYIAILHWGKILFSSDHQFKTCGVSDALARAWSNLGLRLDAIRLVARRYRSVGLYAISWRAWETSWPIYKEYLTLVLYNSQTLSSNMETKLVSRNTLNFSMCLSKSIQRCSS